jgi:ketosteroid isomerase-like protein
MSQRNVDLCFCAVVAFNRAAQTLEASDIDAYLAYLSADAELHAITATYVDASSFRGHSGIRQYFAGISAVAEKIHIELDDVRDLGDRVLALGRWQMRGRGSGIEVEASAGWVNTVRDGEITCARSYNQPEEALQAVGLEA